MKVPRFKSIVRWALPSWVGVLVVLTCLTILHFQQSTEGVRVASENLARCRQLSKQIESLRTSKSIALERPVSPADISSQLIQATQVAGIPESQVQEVQHLPPVQIVETDFRRDDTVLRFRSVNLKQLTNLCLHLQSQPHPPIPTSLVLKSPGDGPARTAEETWTIELVLTRLTFAAQSPSKSPVR